MDSNYRRTCLIPALTGRGLIWLLAGVMLPFLALLIDLPFDDLLALLAVFIVAVILRLSLEFLRARAFFQGLIIKSEQEITLLSGNDADIEISLHYQGTRPHATLLLSVDDPPGLKPHALVHRVGLDLENGRHLIQHKVRALSRGAMTLESLTARFVTSSAFAEWQCRLHLSTPISITVYPNTSAFKSSESQPLLYTEQGSRIVEMRGGEGSEFDRLRQYSVGDDLRKIDWKRSARGTSLLVKVYRPETHQRVNIALDCSRRMGNMVDGRIQLDFALDAVASLCQQIVRNDDEVGFFAFDHRELLKLPTRRGRSQQVRIMQSLLSLETSMLEADYLLARRWGLAAGRRSLFVLITSVSSPATVKDIRTTLAPLTRKHLPLLVSIEDLDLVSATREVSNSLQDAYVISAAVQQAELTRQRVLSLARSGIECIHTDITNLPAALVHKYQQLKVAGRL